VLPRGLQGGGAMRYPSTSDGGAWARWARRHSIEDLAWADVWLSEQWYEFQCERRRARYVELPDGVRASVLQGRVVRTPWDAARDAVRDEVMLRFRTLRLVDEEPLRFGDKS
jgi:hypothetical protein